MHSAHYNQSLSVHSPVLSTPCSLQTRAVCVCVCVCQSAFLCLNGMEQPEGMSGMDVEGWREGDKKGEKKTGQKEGRGERKATENAKSPRVRCSMGFCPCVSVCLCGYKHIVLVCIGFCRVCVCVCVSQFQNPASAPQHSCTNDVNV